MADINLNEIVGDSFEDMTISEMTNVQGAGPLEIEGYSLAGFSITFSVSMNVVKSLRTNC